MSDPVIIMLEHTVEDPNWDGSYRSRASRIIIWDVCPETGAQSVRDIMEARNDYLVVRDLLVPSLDCYSGFIMIARPDKPHKLLELKARDPRNQAIQLLNELEPN